jgi:ribosomal protein L9
MAYVGKEPKPKFLGQVDDLDVKGNAVVEGNATVKGDLNIEGTTVTIDSASVQTVDLGDNDKIRLGDSDDAQLYHDGSDLIINNDTGDIAITGANVGIGTSSPSTALHVSGTSEVLRIEDTDATLANDQSIGKVEFYSNDASGAGVGIKASVEAIAEDSIGRTSLVFSTADATTNDNEAMRLDSSGNLLVGKTNTDRGTDGHELRSSGFARHTVDGSQALELVRRTSDGEILRFFKNGTQVGSIGVDSSGNYLTVGDAATSLRFIDSATDRIEPWNQSSNAARDNLIDLGTSGNRFNDVFAANGVTTTSDRNEKQDIEELSEAEQRVAVACKELLRKFRWIDAVEKKGDDARIHFGIIAQDLQAAFEAEGLDAHRYAMFMYNEWWEHDVEVPAVKAVEAQDAVYDEEGNLVSEAVEAVEAKEAYTRTDTYDTEAEAPEGAVERTRLGVRYSELLAFIIAAI